MTNKHTELPWFAHDFTELFGDNSMQVTISCTHPDTITVCSMDRGLTGDIGESRANARLIVTAVNYHHRLREALRGALNAKSMEDYHDARALLAELDNLENGS